MREGCHLGIRLIILEYDPRFESLALMEILKFAVLRDGTVGRGPGSPQGKAFRMVNMPVVNVETWKMLAGGVLAERAGNNARNPQYTST